ncbi:MAG: hypothetical protein E6G97_22365 [Alphaproteobacteria bacterium]|nr:MAG: hypothetical protein E6G97_22365 [Alphaproteobacteria bacterium]
MSPNNNNNNNNGDALGRAASVGVIRTDAARADETAILARGFGLIALSLALLVVAAPELWPRMFAAY